MTSTSAATPAEILASIRVLHQQKDAAYGNSWKKRGEVFSIMANIARKADRLSNASDGAPETPDESHLDTAVDLFVYAVKYCAFLADQESALDRQLFPAEMEGAGRRSDGFEYVNYLLDRYTTTPTSSDTAAVSREVVDRFESLMSSFGEAGFDELATRHARAEELARAAWLLILAFAEASPTTARAFVSATSQP